MTWCLGCPIFNSCPYSSPHPPYPPPFPYPRGKPRSSSKEMSLILWKADPSNPLYSLISSSDVICVTIPSYSLLKRNLGWKSGEKGLLKWNVSHPDPPHLVSSILPCISQLHYTILFHLTICHLTWATLHPLFHPTTILPYHSFLDIRNNHNSPPGSSSSTLWFLLLRLKLFVQNPTVCGLQVSKKLLASHNFRDIFWFHFQVLTM